MTTPEGVTLDLELAGIGSRALAGVLDLVIQGVMVYAAAILFIMGAFAGAGSSSIVLVLVVSIATFIAILVGYHVLFEVYLGGQTPGKRMIGVKVVRMDGGPLGLSHSLIRTFLRIIDYLPALYGIGVIAVFASRRNQRLGDMAAGTVVILDRSRHAKPKLEASVRPSSSSQTMDEFVNRANRPQPAPPGAGWDVSRVTDEELGLTRRFLERRWTLDDHARRTLAADIAGRLRWKVVAPSGDLPDEQFLARLVDIKRG